MKTKLKKLMGFKPSSRTRAEVDTDYQKECVWLGHKSRMLAQLSEDCAKLEKEIQGHLDNLLVLNKEGMTLPPAAPAKAPAPAEAKK